MFYWGGGIKMYFLFFLLGIVATIIVSLLLNGSGASAILKHIQSNFKEYAILVGGLYFIYQAVSGSLFATTTISTDAKRGVNDAIVITATIERGDNWLVEILDGSDQYVITKDVTKNFGDINIKFNLNFARYKKGNNSILKLAPKEKTQTQFIIDDEVIKKANNGLSDNDKIDLNKGFYVISQIEYESVSWPFSAKSVAKSYVTPK
jgi:hypothetical protein